MKDIHDQTYYELLEIDPSATQEEILKAYNRARATYGHNSPALYSLFNKEEAQELLKLIDEAYAVLSNQFKRRQYDTKAHVSQDRVSQGTPPVTAPPPQESASKTAADTDFAIPSAAAIPEFSDFPAEPPAANASVAAARSETAQTFAPDPGRIPIRTLAPSVAPMPQSVAGMSLSPRPPGSTPFGKYQIDPSFEDEIKKTDVFSGAVIQKIRIYKNVSIDQISELTKISRPYLLAIESNNFTSLPAPVFVRGFIVQIAKILGLEPVKTSNSFIQLLKESQKK